MIPTSKLNQKKNKKKANKLFQKGLKLQEILQLQQFYLPSTYNIYEYFSCVTEKSHLTRRKPQLSI